MDGVPHALIESHTLRVEGEEVVGHRVALEKSHEGFRVEAASDDIEFGKLLREPIALEKVQGDKYHQTIASLAFIPEFLSVDTLQALCDLPRGRAG